MKSNTAFNNISLISGQSVLLVEKTGVTGENQRPAASSQWKTLSHKVVSSTPHHERYSNTILVLIDTDYIGSCKSYNTITNTTAPQNISDTFEK